jgi:hypothetical protein
MILVTRIKKTLKMNLPTGENNNQSKWSHKKLNILMRLSTQRQHPPQQLLLRRRKEESKKRRKNMLKKLRRDLG